MYLGRIKNIKDPLFRGRVKIEIADVSEGLSDEDNFWCFPKEQLYKNMFRTPKVDEVVLVEFLGDDLYSGVYTLLHSVSDEVEEILKESYDNAKIIYYDEIANTHIFYTDEKGLMISNNGSFINILKDNSILLSEIEGKKIHLKGGNISIGSINKSEESAVLGETNEKVLEEINTTFEKMGDSIEQNLNALSEAAKGNVHTGLLIAPFKKFATEIKTLIGSQKEAIAKIIPETKSKIVTIDKE